MSAVVCPEHLQMWEGRLGVLRARVAPSIRSEGRRPFEAALRVLRRDSSHSLHPRRWTTACVQPGRRSVPTASTACAIRAWDFTRYLPLFAPRATRGVGRPKAAMRLALHARAVAPSTSRRAATSQTARAATIGWQQAQRPMPIASADPALATIRLRECASRVARELSNRLWAILAAPSVQS